MSQCLDHQGEPVSAQTSKRVHCSQDAVGDVHLSRRARCFHHARNVLILMNNLYRNQKETDHMHRVTPQALYLDKGAF
jgi:hypothetical protein